MVTSNPELISEKRNGVIFEFILRNMIKLARCSTKNLIVLTTGLFFLFGCTSTTYIKSNPPGAKFSLDGKLLGETPTFYSDKAAAGTTRTVTLKKEGYKDFNGYIKREKLSIPILIGGIFLIVPLVWVLEYPSEYNFEMEKL